MCAGGGVVEGQQQVFITYCGNDLVLCVCEREKEAVEIPFVCYLKLAFGSISCTGGS